MNPANKDDSQVSPLLRTLRGVAALGGAALHTPYLMWRDHRSFDQLRALCLFIGYPRSGHSIVGALLDAHPEMAIAHEQGLFRLLWAGFGPRSINALLLHNSRVQARRGRRVGQYSYSVEGQWQGRFTTLRVIGDKHAEGATLRLQARPWLLGRLRDRYHLDIRFVHVVRNPFDTISTIFRMSPKRSLVDSIEHYFSLCGTVSWLKREIDGAELFELRHESFVVAPKDSLVRLCRFLGVDAPDDYADACAGIVHRRPHRSRELTPWDEAAVALVRSRMDGFEFLKGYGFTEEVAE